MPRLPYQDAIRQSCRIQTVMSRTTALGQGICPPANNHSARLPVCPMQLSTASPGCHLHYSVTNRFSGLSFCSAQLPACSTQPTTVPPNHRLLHLVSNCFSEPPVYPTQSAVSHPTASLSYPACQHAPDLSPFPALSIGKRRIVVIGLWLL
jgi:hypothetical protein